MQKIINRIEKFGWIGRSVCRLEAAAIPLTKGINVGINVFPNGVCNLKCPSCPVGNTEFPKSPHMSMETFRKVLDKLQKEVKIRHVALASYNEPLIYDNYYKYVGELTRRGIKSLTPTNLNIMPPQKLFDAGLDDMLISVSGFTNEYYQRHHAGGDIDIVKDNIINLWEMAGDTTITVLYHRYEDNQHEVRPMREYAKSLGFEFFSYRAYYRPAEKAIYQGNPCADGRYVSFANPSHRNMPCRSHYKQLVVLSDCRVPVCCHVVGDEYYLPGVNFLTTPIKEIRRKQGQMRICVDCKSLGYHTLYNNNEALD